MVMWRFRVPLIRVEASLRLSDLMYHTKQKNGGYFYARQGLPLSLIHISATQQRLVGSVDDGVHLHFRDVISDDLKRHDSILRPIKAASVSGRSE